MLQTRGTAPHTSHTRALSLLPFVLVIYYFLKFVSLYILAKHSHKYTETDPVRSRKQKSEINIKSHNLSLICNVLAFFRFYKNIHICNTYICLIHMTTHDTNITCIKYDKHLLYAILNTQSRVSRPYSSFTNKKKYIKTISLFYSLCDISTFYCV